MSQAPLRIPKVIGHRGAALRAPENTLASFRKAAELGCTWIECDVRLSREDHPIIVHDDTLERTTDGRGRVGAMLLRDLQSYDAGSYFNPSYRGERIPTLEEALRLLQSLGLGCDLELKAEAGREQALAEAVVTGIDRFWSRDFASLVVTSFSAMAINAFGQAAPYIPLGYLTRDLAHDWQARTERFGAVAVVCDHSRLGFKDVRSVSRAGYPLLAYTVNDVRRAKELFAWGTHSVISDMPDAILAALGG